MVEQETLALMQTGREITQAGLNLAYELLHFNSITDVDGNEINEKIVDELSKGKLEVTTSTSFNGIKDAFGCTITIVRGNTITKTDTATIGLPRYQVSISMTYDQESESFQPFILRYGISGVKPGQIQNIEEAPTCSDIKPTERIKQERYVMETPFTPFSTDNDSTDLDTGTGTL